MQQLMRPCTEAQTDFAEYVDVLRRHSLTHNSEVACEVQERLEFIFFAIAEITTVAAVHMEQHSARMERARAGNFDGGSFGESEPLFFKIKFYTEALYMHAFRIRDALRHRSEPLPGLSSFEAPSVRDVRNHLLTHPEGRASQIVSQSFQWGPETGSIIKPRRSSAEVGRHTDMGLVHNMSEFFGNFTRTVELATRQYPAL